MAERELNVGDDVSWVSADVPLRGKIVGISIAPHGGRMVPWITIERTAERDGRPGKVKTRMSATDSNLRFKQVTRL
jgi:hypothetical protein